MSNDYGQWSEAGYDFEKPDPISPYDRVCSAIYHMGMIAANFATPPTNPYKRSDHARIWQLGFDDEVRKIETEADATMYPWGMDIPV